MNIADVTFEKREKLVRSDYRLFVSQDLFLESVAKEEGIKKTHVLRNILTIFQKNYMHKKGVFNCQKCGLQRKNKERHEVPCGEEVFVFGDCCYFNDSYKIVIRQML